jgi:hypothetical protein
MEYIMKGFGYPRDDDSRGFELREATLAGTSEEIRLVARFLEFAANEMDNGGTTFGHRHLRDWWKEWNEKDADVIVHTPSAS